MKRVYIVIAIIVTVAIVLYLYSTRTSESYIDSPFNVMVVDGNGNISPITIRPPTLDGIPSTSRIIYVDETGNIGVISVEDVYTSYQGNSSNNVRNLLTVDANNNFSLLSTLNFNPCHVSGDPYTNPNAPNNGTPQKDGTCKCRNNWSGTEKGNGCAICDTYPGSNGTTHVNDTNFGTFAGPDCEYSAKVNCPGPNRRLRLLQGKLDCSPITPPPTTTPRVTSGPTNTPSPAIA